MWYAVRFLETGECPHMDYMGLARTILHGTRRKALRLSYLARSILHGTRRKALRLSYLSRTGFCISVVAQGRYQSLQVIDCFHAMRVPRVQYAGETLHSLQAVSAYARPSSILLSHPTFQQLPWQRIAQHACILQAGTLQKQAETTEIGLEGDCGLYEVSKSSVAETGFSYSSYSHEMIGLGNCGSCTR